MVKTMKSQLKMLSYGKILVSTLILCHFSKHVPNNCKITLVQQIVCGYFCSLRTFAWKKFSGAEIPLLSGHQMAESL